MPILGTGVSQPGLINQAGTEDALFLKLWAGEVQTAMDEIQTMDRFHKVLPVINGKSRQFPSIGRITGAYHTRGNNILTDGPIEDFNHAEIEIFVDDVFYAATFLSELDELKNHYEVRSTYTKELAQALASRNDRNALIALARGARSNTTSAPDMIPTDLGTEGGGGFVDIAQAAASYTSAELLAGLHSAGQILDEKSFPRNIPRFAPISPADYWLLVDNDDILNRDFGNTLGVRAMGQVWFAGGFELIMTNHLPTGTLANPSGAGGTNSYYGIFGDGTDNTNYITTVFAGGDAIRTVQIKGTTLEVEYKMEYQGTPMLAKQARGTQPLQFPACVEIGDWGGTQGGLS